MKRRLRFYFYALCFIDGYRNNFLCLLELHFCWFSSTSLSFWSIFHNVNLIFADSYAYVTKLKLYLYKTVYVSFAKWAFLFISGFISFTTDIVRMEREREREREMGKSVTDT